MSDFYDDYQISQGWTPPPVHELSRVTIGLQDVTMHGSMRDAPVYGLTDWDGWSNGTNTRGGPEPHATGDGGVTGRVDMAGRNIRLEGLLKARDLTELWQMREQLGAILTRPRADWLTVQEDMLGTARQVWVTRPTAPQITVDATRRRAIFTIELEAADWRRVDMTQSTLNRQPGQNGPLVNTGNVEAALAAVLTGPLTNPKIAISGQGAWEYIGTIAAGQTIGVDFENRLVRDTANGVLLRKQAKGTWPHVAPGTATATITGSGTGTVDLRWRSSWS